MKKVMIGTLVIVMLFGMTLGLSAKEYTVQPGDVLWKIAEDNNTSVEALTEINELDNPNLLYSGQVLSVDKDVETDKVILEEAGFEPKETISLYYNLRDDGYGYIVGGTGEFAGVTGRFAEFVNVNMMGPNGELDSVLELRFELNEAINYSSESKQDETSTPETTTVPEPLEVTKEWEADGFVQAESVLYVPNHEWLYTSNVNDQGEGYISRLSLDGRVDNYTFTSGLPLPLGMAYYENEIYVASSRSVKVIDINSGLVVKELKVPVAGMLNDLTITPEGELYVTDSQTGKIYTSNGQKLLVWVESPEFMMLNGIFYDQGIIYVSNMDMQNMTGSIHTIDVQTKEITTRESMNNIGAIDGISKLGNNIIASNAGTMELIMFVDDAVVKLGVFEGGMADINVNQETGEVYIPYLNSNKVEAYSFK